MLDKLRNFSKGKLAAVLVAIIIVPFVFWGMGSVFSGGNTNSVAKINNHNISTKDFINFVNNSKINPETIKNNIENKILEQLLSSLVSEKLIDIEIDELKVYISDKDLANKIRNQKFFYDENKIFSRTKYEKYLLENNISAIEFELNIKNNELKKKLFSYIGGGIRSPYFLINNTYKNQSKKVEIEYLDLNSIYTKKSQINNIEINEYVEKNKDNLSIEKLDISYVKITPENISENNEFTENFFSKIDEIENLVINNYKIKQIANKYNLKLKSIKNYHSDKNEDALLKEIYNKKNEEKIQLLDKNDFFLLYEITKVEKILPKLNDAKFVNKIKNDIFEFKKYELHKDLLNKIENKNFTNENFIDLSKDKLKNTLIDSINDTKIFTEDSVNLIYSLNKNSFLLISDENDIVYLAKIKNVQESNLNKNNQEISTFTKLTNSNLRNNIYNSYDYLLNEKYKIKVNQNTVDRIKNYFK